MCALEMAFGFIVFSLGYEERRDGETATESDENRGERRRRGGRERCRRGRQMKEEEEEQGMNGDTRRE